MPFPWIAAAQAIAAAASAYMDHVRNRDDAAQRERDRDLILAAIRDAKSEIISEVVRQRMAELTGALEGFESVYASYDADPNDPAEEERLRSLIDDTAVTIGQLGALIDPVRRGGVAADVALQAWPIYVQLLYLRAQAMTERQVTYGAAEIDDAVPTLQEAVTRGTRLLSYLHGVSDARFGAVQCGVHQDAQGVVCWYRFGRSQIVCGRNPKVCEDSRKRHMTTAYGGFEGVRQITASVEGLRQAIGTISTLSLLDRFGRVLGGPVLPAARVSASGHVEVDDEDGAVDLARVFTGRAPVDDDGDS
jgi:hypothetical protein